ncbi:MAG: hypothetical protein ACXWID_15495 [Pyrinomonadaceae bacterium]
MGTKVEDLVRQIRTEASAQGGGSPDKLASLGSANGDLDRLRAGIVTARRAQDRLPPITTYRRGFVARFELWVKRRLKAATRWFTWEQANFNVATVTSLENAARLLAQLEAGLSDLRSSIQGHELAEPDTSIAAVDARLAKLESSVQSLLTEIQSERTEQTRRIDLLIEEQRVCFRQVALEISETAIVSDRAKRNLEMQLADLSQRLDEANQKEKAATDGR